jgi:hypothetical protein
VKPSRVQQAIKILNSSAEEFYIDKKPRARKTTAKKKAKKVVKKPLK